SAALSDGNMITRLPKGGSMLIPPVYLGVYRGDVDDGSNAFKRWFVREKAPKNMLADPREPLVQQDMQLGYDVAKYGIQLIKMDYGWWSDEKAGPTWRTHEGLLEMHNSDYLKVLSDHGCRTLEEYVRKAKNAGVGVTMYILLKDTQLDRKGVPTSVGEYGHPEWFSDVNVTGMGCSADLGNSECVAFYKKYLLDFFKKTGVSTWRSDFEPICRTSPRENRHLAGGNDVQYWATVGFGELVDHLRARLPGFRYESCSSGGSMKDLWTMTRASVINCDDSADYMSLHMSFYDSSYCIHPMQLQIPCNALTYTRGSENYTGTADYLYGLRCQLTGAVMLSNWQGTTDEDKAYWPYHVKDLYEKRLKPLIRNGDLYHILPRPDGIRWDGLEYFDPDADTGAVMLWKPSDEEGKTKTVRLRGLDPDREYRLDFEDRSGQSFRAKGAGLLEKGLAVTIQEPAGSEIVWISPADKR
ncbi:MAG: GH36 C-terminal domain-containing protein, partial [Abditibacteriota bacterium]|nr:GH36 C-terminal domain-containing protein [Abditibacteriota bacterium]